MTVKAILWFFIPLFAISFSTNAQVSQDSLPTGHLPDAAEEYWPESKDTIGKQDFLQRIKHNPIRDGKGFISVGGTLREGYENYKNYLWGLGTQDNNGYSLHRLLLHADVRWNHSIRFFSEIENSLVIGRNGGPRPVVDENKLAVNQAFAEFAFDAFNNSHLKLRLGKQEPTYGIGSLLDLRDVNVRFSLAGGKLIFEHGNTKIDAFLMEAIQNNPSYFDDRLNKSQKIGGAWMTQTRANKFFNKIDAFYIFIDRDAAQFNQGTGHEYRSTVGADAWFQTGNLGGYSEGSFQFGHFSNGPILAWKIVQSISYKFQDIKFKPVFSLNCAISSGDQSLDDNKLQTFNPIYPRGVYYGYMDNVGSSNMIVVHEKLEIPFNTRLALALGYYKFWRESISDGVYLANGLLLFPSSNSARHVSDMYDLKLSYTPVTNMSISLFAAYDKRGQYLLQQPNTLGDSRYLAARVEFAF